MMNSVRNNTKSKTALVLGGGAPNSTLIAGALVAFYEKNAQFDVISCSGAGALMGLLYTAPKNKDPVRALKEWARVGVSDSIYQLFPVNYKVFMKPGSAAEGYRSWLTQNPFTAPFFDPSSPVGNGLFTDWVRLGLASMSPTSLSMNSLGLCAHLPFADDVIDFTQVRHIGPEFYINAYNIDKEKMRIWGKQEITAEHLKAALAFPMIYPPYKMEDGDYIEGAAIDTLNFKALVNDDPDDAGLHPDIDNLVIFDILGDGKLIRKPRNLYDSWVKSIITPLVKIAKDNIALFEYRYNLDRHGNKKRNLYKVDLMGGIDPEHWPEVMDWSHSNLQHLFDIGYNAGLEFCRQHPEMLGLAVPTQASVSTPAVREPVAGVADAELAIA